jgi:hypothetical protein
VRIEEEECGSQHHMQKENKQKPENKKQIQGKVTKTEISTNCNALQFRNSEGGRMTESENETKKMKNKTE